MTFIVYILLFDFMKSNAESIYSLQCGSGDLKIKYKNPTGISNSPKKNVGYAAEEATKSFNSNHRTIFHQNKKAIKRHSGFGCAFFSTREYRARANEKHERKTQEQITITFGTSQYIWNLFAYNLCIVRVPTTHRTTHMWLFMHLSTGFCGASSHHRSLWAN